MGVWVSSCWGQTKQRWERRKAQGRNAGGREEGRIREAQERSQEAGGGERAPCCAGVFPLPPLHTLRPPSSPVLSKVKISPSHLALLGVLGSELQLERRRIFRLGEMGSSVEESRSEKEPPPPS